MKPPRPLARALLLLALVLPWAFGGCAAWGPTPRGERVVHNLPYATHHGFPLHLDLYLPAARKGPAPLVMWIHGGGWVAGTRGFQFFVRRLTEQGFAIASIDYRLAPFSRYPAQIEDCRDALHFLQRVAPQYGCDARRVFLAGSSAGGHLSALLGLEEGRGRIAAVLAMYPPTDLNGFDNPQHRFGYLPALLGGPVTEKRALAAEASPINHVTRAAPPFLFFHGSQDKLVPLSQSEKLHQRLRATGIESHLVVLEKPHNFSLTNEQLQQVGAFFRRHLR